MSSNVIVDIAILVGRLSCLLIFSQCMKPRSRTIGACKRLPTYRLLRIFIELFRDPVKKKSEKKETKKRANKQTNKQTTNKQTSKQKQQNTILKKPTSCMSMLRKILTAFRYLLQVYMPDHVARAFECIIIAAKIWLQGWFIITSPQLDSWTFAPVKSSS